MVYEGKSFYSTFVYGDNDNVKRRSMWKELLNLNVARGGAWFLSGDYNDIICDQEKSGGIERTEGSFMDLGSFMSEGDLYDLKHSGDFLSWRGVRYEHVVHCRLNRAAANSEWFEEFYSGHCEYLKYGGSDHKPIISCFDTTRKKRKGLFRFDRRLKDNPAVQELIDKHWKQAGGASVCKKIAIVQGSIVAWNKKQQQNSRAIIEQRKIELEEAMTSAQDDAPLIAIINQDLREAYKAEEDFWRQRTRVLWLSLGDRNTGYFHATTKGRKALNSITVLEDVNGEVHYKEEMITKTIVNYFTELFTSHEAEREQIVHDALTPLVSDAENELLVREPTAEEIRLANFSIHSDKAPGPDGFSAGFFQTNWKTVGADIVREVQSFFSSGLMPSGLNDTHIRMISKGGGPRFVADYRPIALCNVYYKIISKLLTRRLQPILSKLISENQSAFVPDRAISDNVLITHEVLHFLKTSSASKHCSMAVKTDMSKAYDRLEWKFIEMVLSRLGFHQKWVGLIMQCVTSVSFSFLINDSAQGRVYPSRGIRHGDPLSPYLFILCSEVLSGLCAKADQNDGSLQGIRVATDCPRVNHLLFADDTMFFCRTNAQSILKLQEILQLYEQASGQRINKEKSAITFSKKMPQSLKDKVKRELDIQKEGGVGKYLGLPEHFGRKKKDLFTSIVDRIRQKAVGWSTRCLSTAGKLILLKTVLSAMPTNSMSCFKLPTSLCKRIQSALTRFWWDSDPDQRKMSWISWTTMTRAKQDGGLGFRDIQCVNDALLGKLSWRLINNLDELLARILRGKYCKYSPILEVQAASNCSNSWRSILIGRDLVKEHLGWAIGNGESVKISSDAWLSTSHGAQPIGPATEQTRNALVKELFQENTCRWSTDKITHLFPELAPQILSIKTSSKGEPDNQIWLKHESGVYSTKTGYQAALKSRTIDAGTGDQPAFQWAKKGFGG